MNASIAGLGLFLALLLPGCASRPPAISTGASNIPARARIEQRIEEIFDAARKKDMQRLDSYHLYGPSFTKFGGGQAGRLESEAARKGEHAGLGAIQVHSMAADQLKIDLFGETAVATFVMRYSFAFNEEATEKMERTTLVFVNDHGDWKIAHEHLSPYSNPPNQ